MPRQPRIYSKSGIYHIMIRGINKQNIFECDRDKDKFLYILKDYKAIAGFKVYAYCLMSNHVHLLIKIKDDDLSSVMKKIAVRYVTWYNSKHKRMGHLFHDRFRSEPVETEDYFLTALRYIHQNPVKAGICAQVSDYKYSSYQEYINGGKLIDTDFCFELLDTKHFIEFNNEYTDEHCIDIQDARFVLTDEEAELIIQNISGLKDAKDIKNLDVDLRNKFLEKCRKSGISIRQLSDLTGISINTIRKF